MQGLLERARQLRQAFVPQGGAAPVAGDGLTFDAGSGITQDEQKEIRAEIEKVATGSRIAVDPGMFVVKAAKRGVLFPLLVNVVSLAVLAVGLVVLYLVFQSQETQISREDTVTITAEGKLLAEVKKESEAKLQEKNQQINDIQGRLAQIDKQRLDLQSNMDAQVQQKEADLRASLAAELDAEKARLQKQGLSDQDIQKKLADLETQKNAAFQKDLDAFKAQADAERRQSEAALKDLQAQYSSDLAKANTERQQVLADSRQREADLQAHLAAQSKAAQAQQAQTQQQLAALSSQKTQEDLVSQQLVGLYSVAQTDIAARDYAHALTSLQAIGTYVNSVDVAALPGMAKRRPVDLFIVDSLTSLVHGEIDKGKADTSSLVEASNRIADIRARVTEADAQVKAGRLADAEKQYAAALAVLPEVSRSYAFFTARAVEVETARQTALDAALARAEAAWAGGKYPDMLSAYRDALGYLPETSARLDATLANIAAAGAAQGSAQAAQKTQADQAAQKAQADQTRAAGPLIAQADTRMAQGSFADAVASYIQLLQNYPQSAQAPQALQGISRGVSAMNAAAAEDRKQTSQVGVLNGQIATLQQSLAASTGELTRVKKTVMDLLGQRGDPEKTDSGQLMAALAASYGSLSKAGGASASLQAQLDAAQKAAQDSANQVSALTEENTRLRESVQAAQAQAAQAAQKAQGAQGGTTLSDADAQRLKRFDQVVESYKKYAALEGPVAAGAATDLRKTYGYRETFLQSAGSVFDGLVDRIHTYDQGFLSAGIAQGKDDTLKTVASIVMELGRQKTPADQKAFFDAKLAAARDDRGLSDVMKKLQALLPGS